MAHNITKKQAGVIYGAWKRGNISATKETINLVYGYAEYFVSTDSTDENLVTILRECIDAIFANDYDEAQQLIDRFVNVRNLHFVAA